MKNTTLYIAIILAMTVIGGCSDDTTESSDKSAMPMTFTALYPGATRATETEFEDNDRIGVFVTNDNQALQPNGNYVNNEMLTLNDGNWETSQQLYWGNDTYNAYAYYPYTNNITSTEAQPFKVSTDQDMAKSSSALSGYEASDLLFASSKGLKASASPIALQFRHVMSRLKIRLIKSEDYEGDMPTTAQVFVHNTIPSATVDLTDGTVSPDPNATRQTIIAHKDGDYNYSAIIVPQDVDYRIPLIEVVMNGVSYIFESTFNFKSGIQYTVNIILSGNPEQMKIDIGGETTDWK